MLSTVLVTVLAGNDRQEHACERSVAAKDSNAKGVGTNWIVLAARFSGMETTAAAVTVVEAVLVTVKKFVKVSERVLVKVMYTSDVAVLCSRSTRVLVQVLVKKSVSVLVEVVESTSVTSEVAVTLCCEVMV